MTYSSSPVSVLGSDGVANVGAQDIKTSTTVIAIAALTPFGVTVAGQQSDGRRRTAESGRQREARHGEACRVWHGRNGDLETVNGEHATVGVGSHGVAKNGDADDEASLVA